jgi:hypothetical protein
MSTVTGFARARGAGFLGGGSSSSESERLRFTGELAVDATVDVMAEVMAEAAALGAGLARGFAGARLALVGLKSSSESEPALARLRTAPFLADDLMPRARAMSPSRTDCSGQPMLLASHSPPSPPGTYQGPGSRGPRDEA